MNINKYHYAFFVLIIFVMVFFMFMIFSKEGRGNDDAEVSCHAEYNLKAQDIIMKVSVYLTINYGYHANFDIIGDMIDHNKNYKISRYYDFDYKKISSERYLLTNFKLSKRISDNALDTQVLSSIFNLDSKDETVINIKKIMNAYVIGNMHSPFFICVRR